MVSRSVGIKLTEVKNIIDIEFEKARSGDKLNLLTSTFVNRVEDISAKQQELKGFLESLEVQIKNLGIPQTERRSTDVSILSVHERFPASRNPPCDYEKTPSNTAKNNDVNIQIGAGKDTPIVIDDEDDPKQIVDEPEEPVTPIKDTVEPVEILEEPGQEISQQEPSSSPIIHEESPTIEPKNDTSAVCEETPDISTETGPELSSETTPGEVVLTGPSSSSVPAASVPESDVSTETASSPCTDGSQSSVAEDSQKSEAENVHSQEKSSQEPSTSTNESQLRELERKLEVPVSKDKDVKPTARPHSPSDFTIGTRVLGKRSSDIWFPGQIIKTLKDRTGQVKYSVKYDKGPKGVLSLNHICPEEPGAMCDISVGSRVVALYGNLNIWYAGIIAEMACHGNKNRLLVFFDDGFAQYLSIKKIHKVHHKGQNVWEDVIEDSRDFIQEYLEEYPSRPMLHVRVGQWIRTEWKGQWLKARVMSVDGSLVKMLFQIDNRSEWIYRGSTRLDPLYTALVMGEKTRSTKARSRKLTRNTSSKDNAPYIEYNITKPCYGVSPYSKTDPKGIQQSQLEEQRQMTQRQHEGLKHPKFEDSRPPAPATTKVKHELKSLEKAPAEVEKVKSPSPPTINENKQVSTEVVTKKEVVILDDEPEVESTYSCIQASTMRKKTGASLVNNVIFKAVSPVDTQPYPIPLRPSPVPPSTSTISSQTSSILPQTSSISSQTSSLLPQTSSVLPQTSSISSQTSSLLPQTSSVLPQTSSISPQTSSILPQTSSMLPQTSSMLPQTSSMLPQTSSMLSQTSSMLPQTSSMLPQTSSMLPQTSSMLPQTSSMLPQTSSMLPQTSSMLPQTSSMLPQTSSMLSRPILPKPQLVLHRPPTILPRPPTILPRPPTILPRPPTILPRPPTILPRPPTIQLQPSSIIPQPASILPRPSSTSHQPPLISPQPSSISGPVPVYTKREASQADHRWKAPWLNLQRNQRHGSSDNVIRPYAVVPTQKYHDAATILKNKLDAKILKADDTKLTTGILPEKREIAVYKSHTVAVPHKCSFACSRSSSKISIDPLEHNPLAVPILMDWKREIVKRRGKTNKRDVYYRTPCNRRLRNMTEVIRYLQLTGESSLNVDHFTFDWRVRTDNVTPPVAVVNDISSGQENRPLPAVNQVDGTLPPNIQYMSMRQFAPEVELTTDPGFMVCCDCKDNCSDANKCACIQLTLQGCKAMDMKDSSKMTYQYRRLRDCIQTGIYECNSECSCSKNCLNRVVQNGIQLRLEVFKTENRGWGLRATDSIPAGTFVCTYAGYILNEELANQDGRKYGDEYMAELDYIEVAEKAKEGYESDVSDLEEDDNIIDDMLQSDDNFSYSGNSAIESRNEDDDDEDDDVDDDDDEDDDDDDDDYENIDDGEDDGDAQGGYACGFYEDSSSSSNDGNDKDKNFNVHYRKKRRISSVESLVVERETKANVLSRLGSPLMCVLALKRNDGDLEKTSQFLKMLAPGSDTSMTMVNSKEDTCQAVDEVSVSSADNSCTAVLPSKAASDELSYKNNEKLVDKTIPETASLTAAVEGEAKDEIDTDDRKNNYEEANPKEGIAGDAKDDIPQLLSANDLQRLAASQPKSLQPPVLTRRGTVLDETIEKLKKRVVAPDSSLLGDVATDKQSCSSEIDNDPSQTAKYISTSDNASSCHGDKDDDKDLHSETSSPSRNSSSLSQSTSSRSSSPAFDLVRRFKKNNKSDHDGRITSEKEGESTQGQNSNTRFLRTRSLFGEEHCYVIDATFGNCGRFLNHSCSPNLFVQNVFIDTHDMRFPWVAFFAQNNIKAGSELTWDYMYEVGSVRDKSLYCLCGSSGCRGRLL
ncbi:uncharacterized protein LOC114527359 [Dendronephthya gigantea]|uniref:uncharacterized protein LOC114527359 n=1 Tax=Dendronephthya gigantea TaxID=151771 RepID=UPI00106AAF68|nr:uncharacterized protein LOC114527359 [Dendronephthya gigantea]